MVKVVLHGSTQATCTQRVMILLEELDLQYEMKEVNMGELQHKAPEYLQLNPFGKVPALEYGGHTLFESRAMLRYIAKHNREELNLYGDVNVDVWLEAESNNYNGPVSAIIYETVLRKMFDAEAEVDKEVIDKNIVALEKVLDVYERRLGTTKYIGGESYSIADIVHIPYTYLMLKHGFKDIYKARPHVYNWLKDIMRRDAVKRVLAKQK